MTTPVIDLEADLNNEDDEGRGWSVIEWARDPEAVVPGAVLVAGRPGFWNVVRIHAVDDDGQVHFDQLDRGDPGVLAELGRAPSA